MANNYGGYASASAQWQSPANAAQAWAPAGGQDLQSTQPAYYTAAVPTDPRIQTTPRAVTPRAAAPQAGAWQTTAGWQKGGSLANYEQQGQAAQQAYYVPAPAAATPPAFNQDFSQDNFGQPQTQSPYQSQDTYQQQQPQQNIRYPQPNQNQFTPRGHNPNNVPQAEVFRAANQKIMNRMRGPSPRGPRPQWGNKGGFNKSNTPQRTPNRGPALYPMQLLNETGIQGLFWQHNQEGEGKDLVCTASVKHNGNNYTGTGRTKKDAMNEAAKSLLHAIGHQLPTFMEEGNANGTCIAQLYQLLTAKKSTSQLEFTYSLNGPPFEGYCTFNNRKFTGYGATKKVAKASVAQKILEAINNKEIEVPVADPSDPVAEVSTGVTTPLGTLNSRLGTSYSLDWHIESVKSNTDNTTMHTAYLTLNGRQFIGHHSNKKSAKNAVAQQILDAANNGTFELPVTKGRKRIAGEGGDEGPAAKHIKKEAGDVNPTMHPLSQCNQLFPGIITWAFESSGPPHCPLFNAIATVQGKTFSSSAGTKKDSKVSVCNFILGAVAQGELTPCPHPKKQPQPKAEAMDMSAEAADKPADTSAVSAEADTPVAADVGENPISAITRMFGTIYWDMQEGGSPHDPLFVARMTQDDKTFTGTAGTKKAAKLKCAQNALASVEAGELKPPKQVGAGAPITHKPSGRVVHTWPDLLWTYVQEGDVHKPVFTAVTNIDGVSYQGLGASKKAAKHEACRVIVEALEAGSLKAPEGRGSLYFSLTDIKRFNKVFATPRIDMEDIGMDGNPCLKATITIDDKQFSAQGATIAAATGAVIEAINEALKCAEIKVPALVQFYRRFKYPRINVSNKGTDIKPLWEATYKHWNNTYRAVSEESPDAAEREVAQKAVSDLDSGRSPANKEADIKDKTPCAILNEKASATGEKIILEIVDRLQDGPLPYICTATVQGQEYQGSGRSKGAAKHNCAAVILANVFGHVFDIGNFEKPENANDMDKGDIGDINHLELSTLVHTMVANTYAEVIRSIPPKFRGRKVLAGCVMVRGNDLGSSETIAIAAGTKCINGGGIRHDGRAVNDMHAEILVRRALKRYLLTQIELLNSGKPSIVIRSLKSSGPDYKLVDGIRFHLFISSPPCGDSRIFHAGQKDGEEYSGDDNPDRQNRGQIRVKMETGQGTIPVKQMGISKIQSWEGIASGDRYLNMSCCDKVSRWTVLGFQGSLLSTLLEPVYFSSVVVGSMFNQAHIYRGLYGRLKGLETLTDTASPYKHHCPEIIGTVTPELRNTLKPPNHAVLWQAMDGTLEVIDNKTGMLMDHNISSVCKKQIFGLFRKLVDDLPDIYVDCKKTATKYEDVKNKLYAGLEARGYGYWIHKPVEQDMFTYTPEVPAAKPPSLMSVTVDAPVTPGIPVTPGTPATPVTPGTPATPVTPGTPVTPVKPDSSVTDNGVKTPSTGPAAKKEEVKQEAKSEEVKTEPAE